MALISERFGVAVFSVALAGLCILLNAARLRARPEQAEGYTTFAVMIKTFFLGTLIYIGERNIAVMLAAGTMVLREVGVARSRSGRRCRSCARARGRCG